MICLSLTTHHAPVSILFSERSFMLYLKLYFHMVIFIHSFIKIFYNVQLFCRCCVVIRFFHPRHNDQWPPTSKHFYTRSYPLHYFLVLILEKEQVFPFSMLSAKQWNYWYHFYNVFGMTRSLTGDWTRDLPHSKPASTTGLLRRRFFKEYICSI